jgi:hypothetical protein
MTATLTESWPNLLFLISRQPETCCLETIWRQQTLLISQERGRRMACPYDLSRVRETAGGEFRPVKQAKSAADSRRLRTAPDFFLSTSRITSRTGKMGHARQEYISPLSSTRCRANTDLRGLTGVSLFLRSRLRWHHSGHAVVDHQLAIVFAGVLNQRVSQI